ncbi:MAG: hypothetical protein GXP30_02815 [Verrucomicrobia bacterium]|nr:hypothetical protein [Verrucomicrobiota bacterium]
MNFHRTNRFYIFITSLVLVCAADIQRASCQQLDFDKATLLKWKKIDAEIQEKAPSFAFRAAVHKAANPNVILPSHVPAKLGEVTLFADYNKKSEKGVPLYLVNRTGKAVGFACQDGDIYLKLEIKGENKQWVRAQNHRSSWCGNSYYGVTLNAGEYYSLMGYMPEEGVAATVRYRTYQGQEIVSNPGLGLYVQSDRVASSLDSLAKKHIPQAMLAILSNTAYRSRGSKVNLNAYVATLALFPNTWKMHIFDKRPGDVLRLWTAHRMWWLPLKNC